MSACAEPTEHHLHRTSEMMRKMNTCIQNLEAEVLRLSKSTATDYDLSVLQRKLDYKDRMIALKDSVLEVASKEHLRFMRLYLERNDEMAILRQTNETLVKKILKLEWLVFNHGDAHGSEGIVDNRPLPCKDLLLARAPVAERTCRLPVKCRSNAAVSHTFNVGGSA